MTPRRYRLGKRAEQAEATRERIVRATFALHSERGVLATSMKDIADRADVSVGTVYHHFPTYGDAVVACGRYASEIAPAPTVAVLDGLRSRSRRVTRMVHELFAFFERIPGLEKILVERDRVADVLLAWLRRAPTTDGRCEEAGHARA